MIQFRDQEISNERLTLESATEVCYLGHNLTLRNCNIVIKTLRGAARDCQQFIDCARSRLNGS